MVASNSGILLVYRRYIALKIFRSSPAQSFSTQADQATATAPLPVGASRMQAWAGVLHPKHDRGDRQDKHPRQYRFSCSTSGRSTVPRFDPDSNNAECGDLKISFPVLLLLRGYLLQAWVSRRGLLEGCLICSPQIYPAPTVHRVDKAFRLVIRPPGTGYIHLYRDKVIAKM